MTVKLADIIQRTWMVINNSSGVLLLHMDDGLDTGFYVPDFGSRYSAILLKGMNGWSSVPAPLRKKAEVAAGRLLNGIFFNYSDDASRILTEWNYMNRRTNRTPFLIYEREVLDAPKINCVITTSCADYIFAQKMLPQAGILYRNKDTLTNALQIPGIPKTGHMKDLWERWTGSREVFGFSRKYFCEKAYGYPAQLQLIREKHLSMGRDNREKLLYIVLQSLAMEDFEIKALMAMGFIWNRYIQAWIGADGSLDIAELDDFLRKDSLATPATLGFVPEWHADINIESLIRQHSSREMTKSNSAKAFDNSGLWNVIV